MINLNWTLKCKALIFHSHHSNWKFKITSLTLNIEVEILYIAMCEEVYSEQHKLCISKCWTLTVYLNSQFQKNSIEIDISVLVCIKVEFILEKTFLCNDRFRFESFS